MATITIPGVVIKHIQDIVGAQGSIQHMVRSDDAVFAGCGEVYFSATNPGVVKDWHIHDEQTSVISCISGTLTLALHDPKTGASMTLTFGDGDRKVVRIPSGVAYTWRNNSSAPAMIANCASHVHDPAKSRKIPFSEVPHEW
jgi:dTDP-4-dehydrorhamnose 3,5-epimerase